MTGDGQPKKRRRRTPPTDFRKPCGSRAKVWLEQKPETGDRVVLEHFRSSLPPVPVAVIGLLKGKLPSRDRARLGACYADRQGASRKPGARADRYTLGAACNPCQWPGGGCLRVNLTCATNAS